MKTSKESCHPSANYKDDKILPKLSDIIWSVKYGLLLKKLKDRKNCADTNKKTSRKERQNDIEEQKISTLDDGGSRIMIGKKYDIIRVFLSGVYVWQLWFICLVMLQVLLYVSSFNILITHQSNNHGILSTYVNDFATIQLLGVIFTPILGPYIDGRLTTCDDKENSNYPSSKKDEISKKLKRCAVAIVIANSVGILLEITCILPYLKLQYISMLCQVTLRGFLFSLSFSNIAITMPARHYGKLVSAALTVVGIFSCIQYPLLSISENQLEGSLFWIHAALLVLSLTLFGQLTHSSNVD